MLGETLLVSCSGSLSSRPSRLVRLLRLAARLGNTSAVAVVVAVVAAAVVTHQRRRHHHRRTWRRRLRRPPTPLLAPSPRLPAHRRGPPLHRPRPAAAARQPTLPLLLAGQGRRQQGCQTCSATTKEQRRGRTWRRWRSCARSSWGSSSRSRYSRRCGRF